jgi:SAM-dependent methyltransferase
VPHYRTDLAYIHQAGFSEFAEKAATGVIALLHAHGIHDGLVVDVGCGNGVLANALWNAGVPAGWPGGVPPPPHVRGAETAPGQPAGRQRSFHVLGIDASPAMIELARITAPAARFEVATFDRATLPRCSAIIAMGEVLNYGTLDGVRTFIARAAEALRDGGMLLFDVAERGSYPAHDERRIGGEDWSVIVLKDSDGERLTRRVLTFRQLDGTTRRDEEVHELELYDRATLTSLLREHGFRVRVRRSYGSRRLPRGHTVYVATR